MRFVILRASSQYDALSPPHPDAVLDGEDWWIEVDTLADLMCIASECGQLVVEAERTSTYRATDEPITFPPNILIYDTYIE